MRRTKHLITMAPVIVAVAAIVGVGLGPTVLAHEIESIDEAGVLLANELNTIDVINHLGSSVVAVNVAVRGEAVTPPQTTPEGETPEDFDRFQRFFGDEAPVQRSAGSGFLIEFEEHPFLVTNFHVVEGALEPDTADFLDGAEITVSFPADAEKDVSVVVVGVNPSFDLALLQLQDETELPAARSGPEDHRHR